MPIAFIFLFIFIVVVVFLLAVATNSSFFGHIVRYVIGGCFDQGYSPTWIWIVVNLQIRIFASSPLTLWKTHLGNTFTLSWARFTVTADYYFLWIVLFSAMIVSSWLRRNKKLFLFCSCRIDKIKIFNTNKTLEEWMIENATFITINGLLKPVMNLKTGQTKRFR